MRRWEDPDERRRVIKLILAAALVVSGCTPWVSPETTAAADPQPSEFAAMIRWIQAHDEGKLLVDPRPLGIPLGPLVPGSSGYLAGEVGDREREFRLSVLEEFSVDSTTMFPLREGCKGYFLPPGTKVTTGCPAATELETVLDFVGPADSLGLKSVKRVRVWYGHDGAIMEVVEAWLAPRDRGWVVVREEVLASYGEPPFWAPLRARPEAPLPG